MVGALLDSCCILQLEKLREPGEMVIISVSDFSPAVPNPVARFASCSGHLSTTDLEM
jgi:hypothetical protein